MPSKKDDAEKAPAAPQIQGKRSTFLQFYLDVVGDASPQTHARDTKRSNAYMTITRAFVLCFGHKDPLHNEQPNLEYWQMHFDDIPAAKDMPPLSPEESDERDKVILGFVQVSLYSYVLR